MKSILGTTCQGLYCKIFCVSITIYIQVLINILKKKKVQTKDRRKKKKKNSVATVATVPLKQIKNTVVFTHLSNKCYNIFTNGRQKNCNYCGYNAA